MPSTQPPPTEQAKAQLAAGADELSRQSAAASSAAGQAASRAGAEVSAAADQAGAALSDAAAQAKAKAGELVGSAKQEAYAKAAEAKSLMRTKAAEATEAGKQKAATEVNTYGAAIARAADELEKNGEPTAPAVRAAADRVQRFGSYLESKQTSDLLDQAEAFARRHPEVVLGGMFVLGLGLARFFKSTRGSAPQAVAANAGGYAPPQYGTHYSGSTTGGYGGGRVAPPRLGNPAPRAGRPVTVLEETTTVLPANPK